MPQDTEPPKQQPPYLSYTTLRNFLASFKEGVIPSRIDKTLMPGQSGSAQSYLISAMKFLRLIDEKGAPQQNLATLVIGDDDVRKKNLKRILETAYAPVLGDLDLERATIGMLHEKFADVGLTGQTIRKCHSFFAAAAMDAGILLSPQLAPNTRGGGPRKPRKGKNGLRREDVPQEDQHAHVKAGTATLLLDPEGVRSVRLQAPPTVTSAELDRIQKWLSFQLIVREEGP